MNENILHSKSDLKNGSNSDFKKAVQKCKKKGNIICGSVTAREQTMCPNCDFLFKLINITYCLF